MRQVKVCVIGVGYVGEHLVDTFKNGYQVIGVDLNKKRIAYLKQQFKNQKNIHFQSDYENVENCNVFLISVPTLVSENNTIDVSCLYVVNNTLKSIVKPGSLIVIESSVYVGATRKIFGHFREKGVYIGFSPERVDPGRIEPKMEDIPKIISGVDKESIDFMTLIYSKVIKNVVPVSTTECAEMCKLYENCFRMVNIAYVNEISDICDKMGINTYEMINASSTKPFGFMPFYPGLGVGGHCIPVNPHYLFKNGNLPVLKLATDIMTARPKCKAYEITNTYPNAEKILICGLGFKKGESLLTNSPSYKLHNTLKNIHDKNMYVYDPYVEKSQLPEKNNTSINFISKKELPLSINAMDLVIVVHPYANNIINHFKNKGGNTMWFTQPVV
jgi:nucleotide sugar dehydrogenase